MNQCSAAMCVTKFKYIENEASSRSFEKWIFSRCDDACMGTEIRLLLGTYTISNDCNAIGD